MPTLEDDQLVFRFPHIEEDASFSIDFQRTLRIPDTDKTYPLPPGLGSFPVRHVEDYTGNLPPSTTTRGGVFLPMWQAEAMWLNFASHGPDWDLPFPVAIKIAAGKINAVTGESWRPGLHRRPQDYMVSPDQPWLDGFAIEPGVIRQFVAMPLGEGYTAEEQLTSEAEWGGLQIAVIPLKSHVWQAKRRAWEEEQRRLSSAIVAFEEAPLACATAPTPMGLAPGGRMRQVIHRDPYRLRDWDLASAERLFVTLVHAKDWKSITGEPAPNQPPTATDYSRAGLPWFDYYGRDQAALPGSKVLGGMKSVAAMFKQKTGADLPDAQDIETGAPRPLGPGVSGPRQVRTTSAWEA